MKIRYLILWLVVMCPLFFGSGIRPAFAQQKVLRSLEDDITNLVESIKPSLVTIETEAHIGSLEKERRPDFPPTFVGSGIIYTGDGYILTTASVVGGMSKIPPSAGEMFNVALPNGKVVKGKLIGTDDQSNVAVLKVEAKDLTPAKLGNSDKVKVGSWLTVVGNSFGLPNAVALGLVNGLREDGFIQMSANVSPGNSGGPVMDTYGEVIGLVSAKLSEPSYINALRIYEDKTGGQSFTIPAHEIELPSSGVSLALPINKVKIVADDIIKHGSVERGYLGIYPEDLDEVIAKRYGLSKGVLVSRVLEESPAENAGLLENDILLEFGGKELKDAKELRSLIQNAKPKEKVKIKILRDGKRTELTAVLGKAKPIPRPEIEVWTDAYERAQDQLEEELKRLELEMKTPDQQAVSGKTKSIQMRPVEAQTDVSQKAYDQLKEELKRLELEIKRLNEEVEKIKEEKLNE